MPNKIAGQVFQSVFANWSRDQALNLLGFGKRNRLFDGSGLQQQRVGSVRAQFRNRRQFVIGEEASEGRRAIGAAA